MTTMKQGGFTSEDLKGLASDVSHFLQLLVTHPEIICRVDRLDGTHYWACLKPELLAEANEKAMQLWLAHGACTINGVTKHWMDYKRCFCGCPNSVKDDSQEGE